MVNGKEIGKKERRHIVHLRASWQCVSGYNCSCQMMFVDFWKCAPRSSLSDAPCWKPAIYVLLWILRGRSVWSAQRRSICHAALATIYTHQTLIFFVGGAHRVLTVYFYKADMKGSDLSLYVWHLFCTWNEGSQICHWRMEQCHPLPQNKTWASSALACHLGFNKHHVIYLNVGKL